MKVKIKKSKEMTDHRQNESGNVLFLILIAVALFAALSYAVTSSSRSGGNDANNETNLISSATITQYPAAIRTAILRMQVSDGVDISDLEFNAPDVFEDCTAVNSVVGAHCVFHPNGGSATYVSAPADVMDDNQPGVWTFNGDFEINNIGISTDGSEAGNEIIAFLPGIKQGVCNRINQELGITGIPATGATIAGTDDTTAGYNRIMDEGLGIEGTNDILLGSETGAIAGTAALDGQAYGCFRNTASGDYVYFHVLVEQ